MTPQRFEHLTREIIKQMEELSIKKGGEYAPGADRLSNFKDAAQRLGLNPLDVWAVYAEKHWDAITTFIKDQRTGTKRPRLEPIAGRFHDMLVYLTLGLALLEDEEMPKGTVIRVPINPKKRR